jgi:hypothetical protein
MVPTFCRFELLEIIGTKIRFEKENLREKIEIHTPKETDLYDIDFVCPLTPASHA